MPKIGIIGSLVWDLIYGRDPLAPPVEEWGGIAYALAGLDASLPPDWEIVPLIKVGRDLSARGPAAAERTVAADAGRPLRRGDRAQQSGGAPLSVDRAALRADGRRRARLDLGRAGPHGARPRRDLPELHLRASSCAWAPRRRCGRASRDRSTPTSTVCFSACSRTGCGCCSRFPTPRSGSGASTSCS